MLAEQLKALAWECFSDAAYYDMWCVRQVGERTFGQGFHLVTCEEAKALCDMLNARSDGWRDGVEAAAKLCEQWRDENKSSAAKARNRGSNDPGMADMLEGAAIECNALAGEIRNLTPPDTTP